MKEELKIRAHVFGVALEYTKSMYDFYVLLCKIQILLKRYELQFNRWNIYPCLLLFINFLPFFERMWKKCIGVEAIKSSINFWMSDTFRKSYSANVTSTWISSNRKRSSLVNMMIRWIRRLNPSLKWFSKSQQ